jgi:hypothetical protein
MKKKLGVSWRVALGVVTLATVFDTTVGFSQVLEFGTTLWMTIASVGAVDAADANIVTHSGVWAGIKSTAPVPATLNVRYPVVLQAPEIKYVDFTNLRVRYIDNGSDARVKVRLRQYDPRTGVTMTVMTFDSDSFPASNSGQLQETPCGLDRLDYQHSVYFIHAEVIKSGSSGAAWLGSVELRQCGLF